MRIIAGNFKGRRLQTPKGVDIRPTTDKVKEAIFNTIAMYLDDAVVVDLFTGTGNLGLEAISRGAKKCYFCDNARTSLALARDNVEYCKALDQAVFSLGDFQLSLKKIKEKVDIIFLDPPFEAGFLEKSIKIIAELDMLSKDGIIVAEHGKKEDIPEEIFGFYKLKDKRYGRILLSILSSGGS